MITYEDDFILKVEATPLSADNNGYYEIVFGKGITNGTMVIIGNDANGKFVTLCAIDSSGNENVSKGYRQDISSLRFGLNKSLSVTMAKREDSTTYFMLSIADSAGNVITIDRIQGYPEVNNVGVGLGWGSITAYTKIGTWQLNNISFGYEKDASDIKLAIVGHSFVEGNNSTTNNKDKRFSYLLANDIGLKNSMIFGLGGAGVGILNSVKTQISWYKSIRYVLICLGTNDQDDSTTTNAYQNFEDNMSAMGIKTVWLTVPPSRDGTIEKPNINAYIKSHFNYIDIEQIFYDDNGNKDMSMYSDTVHPSIAGYEKMYKLIKSRATQFWEI